MSEQVTIAVAADSLEAAIAGVRRGERWEHDGYRLSVDDGAIRASKYVKETDSTGYYSQEPPPLTGWHRVDAPVLCPRCGAEAHHCTGYEGGHNWYRCPGCSLEDGHHHNPTEVAAREAWERIGGPRWHRVEETPEGGEQWLIVWDVTGEVHSEMDYWWRSTDKGFTSDVSAWRYPSPPPWEVKR